MTSIKLRTCSGVALTLFALTLGSSQGLAGDTSARGDDLPLPQAYVDQFIKDDPAACFGEAELSGARIEGKQDRPQGGPSLRRAVVLIDGSGSMAGRLDGRSKLDLARQAARTFIDSMPPDVEASLIVFGQRGNNTRSGKAQSCAAVDTLAPMTLDRSALIAALSETRAVGWTPLAAAMAQAEAVLQKSSTPGEQVIYLVSDGEETCGGDPVGTARRINAGPTRAIVDIIGFGVPSREAEALQSVAKAGGGAFVHVRTKRAFDETMAILRDSNRVAGNAVRASDAISANAINTSDTVARASTCISNIIADESNRVSNDLAARAGRGEQVPYMSGALALLRARHQDLQARMKAFAERLETAERNARATINKASEVAK